MSADPAVLSVSRAERRIEPFLLVTLAGLALLYLPTLWRLFNGLWRDEGQAHGPMILAIALWLIYRDWAQLRQAGEEFICRPTAAQRPALWVGGAVLLIGLALYVIGRSQSIEFIELGSLIWVLGGALLVLFGPRALRLAWFPLFFMLFMIPLPGLLVAAVTMPMKIAVSYCAEWVLYGLGYPIARTGVILQIGQYQLLVADACAGLHTLLTLEALGLLYLNLFRHESLLRNALLATLIVPISFTANVIRVMLLSLITYYFGDEVGQGYLHGFSGMVLFATAFILVIGTDSLIRLCVREKSSEVMA